MRARVRACSLTADKVHRALEEEEQVAGHGPRREDHLALGKGHGLDEGEDDGLELGGELGKEGEAAQGLLGDSLHELSIELRREPAQDARLIQMRCVLGVEELVEALDADGELARRTSPAQVLLHEIHLVIHLLLRAVEVGDQPRDLADDVGKEEPVDQVGREQEVGLG